MNAPPKALPNAWDDSANDKRDGLPFRRSWQRCRQAPSARSLDLPGPSTSSNPCRRMTLDSRPCYCAGVEPYSGAVLIGGKARRFGADKATYLHHGKPLVQWVVDSLIEADERYLVGRSSLASTPPPCYPDIRPGKGALSGIHAALVHARCDWVAIAACDLPNLSADFWRFLASRREGVSAVTPLGPGGRFEPLAAFYHRSLLPLVESRLAADQLALHQLVEQAGARVVAWRELDGRFSSDLFANVNRPSDLA